MRFQLQHEAAFNRPYQLTSAVPWGVFECSSTGHVSPDDFLCRTKILSEQTRVFSWIVEKYALYKETGGVCPSHYSLLRGCLIFLARRRSCALGWVWTLDFCALGAPVFLLPLVHLSLSPEVCGGDCVTLLACR